MLLTVRIRQIVQQADVELFIVSADPCSRGDELASVGEYEVFARSAAVRTAVDVVQDRAGFGPAALVSAPVTIWT